MAIASADAHERDLQGRILAVSIRVAPLQPIRKLTLRDSNPYLNNRCIVHLVQNRNRFTVTRLCRCELPPKRPGTKPQLTRGEGDPTPRRRSTGARATISMNSRPAGLLRRQLRSAGLRCHTVLKLQVASGIHLAGAGFAAIASGEPH
jgi:hypothetical protein